MTTPRTGPLDRMQYRADELADATIESILGPWQLPLEAAMDSASPAVALDVLAAPWHGKWQYLATVM